MPPGHLLHHDFAVLRCHCHLQLRTPSVWSARPGRCTASALAAQAHTTLAERTKAADTLPEGFRCPVCFDVNFPSRAKLIQHMIKHREHFSSATPVGCPFCGTVCHHSADVVQHMHQCATTGTVSVPASRRHMLTQQQLDIDHRYASLLQADVPLGRVVIRPMHPSHLFEAAILTTEAFLVDKDPPRFDWTMLELERDVLRYAEDPSPITQGIVNMDAIPQWEPPWDPNIAMRDRAEAFRIGQLNAWGRWIWLAAELIPADPSVLSAGQTSVVAGAIALMLHERVSALRKLQPMSRQPPHLLLDSALWVLRSPPASLPTDRAAFMWWTGTASQYRRQGIAQLLLAAAEGVAAKAGFPHAYVQANTKQRDLSSPLGAWFVKEYRAAIDLYARAGYTLWPESQRYTQRNVVLMHKPLPQMQQQRAEPVLTGVA